MNPDKLISDQDSPKLNLQKTLHRTLVNYDESVSTRKRLEHDWSQNQKILKGIPIYDEKTKSSIRKRPKLRFRKVWSAVTRILASLWQAFLSDKQKFAIKGFDNDSDFIVAKVLEIMTRYRLNWLFRRKDGFVKLLWAFMDAIAPGLAVVKVHWKFNEDQEIDEPCLTNYPLEQAALDWTAPTVQEMRYAYLDNYLTKEQLEDMGYENIDRAISVIVPNSVLRDTRYHDTIDPHKPTPGENTNYSSGTVGNAYPEPGQDNLDSLKEHLNARYKAVECFWRRKGKIFFGVFNPEGQVWLKKPALSPYGTLYPLAVGSLLLEAHKLVPESIIQPLAGPQEDLNMTLNLRKDNQLLAMMGGWSVDKFGGVDTQSLSNLRPGFIVRRNPGQGMIEPLKLPDVTQTSYVEAAADQTMIEEMTGIPPVKQGTSNSSKTGVTQLNLQEANAKENLFISTIAETLFRQVIYLLAYEIQLFETDEKIFRVANSQARKTLGIKPEQHDDVFDISFDMDVEIDVGLNEASRAIELQRQFMFLDRALQSNNATTLMLRSGIQMKDPKIIDISQGLEDIARKLNIDDYQKYLVSITPPPQEQPRQQSGGPVGQSVEGANAPQPNAQPADQQGQDEFQEFLSRALQR